jgi:hypothetical protein
MLSAFTPACWRGNAAPPIRQRAAVLQVGASRCLLLRASIDVSLLCAWCPASALARLADRAPTDGIAMGIPRSSICWRFLGALRQRQASVTDDREIDQRTGAEDGPSELVGRCWRLEVHSGLA